MKVTTLNRELKKVTAEQMDMLFEFTRKHYVEYYDVQCELVDHLANAIEERWETQPNLGFNEALHFEFKKFGIFGFTGIVEKRQLALGKRYEKLIWTCLKDFLSLPKVILTLVLVICAYKLGRYSMDLYSTLLMGVIVVSLARLIQLNIQHRLKVKQTGKKWLLESILMRTGGSMVAPYHILYYFYREEPSMLLLWIMAALFVVFALFNYVTLFVIPRRAEEHLLKTYPEYNFEIS
ncbi:hypothetical protein R1T16_04705 [Flavobacterium sp. DG1-102-2]|uniref:hypothetical protein n=1 Tax=Flavobacterium sp. DG1-102-2 TaxID=3081663 RepID=UPI002949067D|nr:hypothetical protein [Flavobacterium sp. DG1-102-2]MDV6167713.1 hypothetical protein [Flavobacterium sp. DG1-102-2]